LVVIDPSELEEHETFRPLKGIVILTLGGRVGTVIHLSMAIKASALFPEAQVSTSV